MSNPLAPFPDLCLRVWQRDTTVLAEIQRLAISQGLQATLQDGQLNIRGRVSTGHHPGLRPHHRLRHSGLRVRGSALGRRSGGRRAVRGDQEAVEAGCQGRQGEERQAMSKRVRIYKVGDMWSAWEISDLFLITTNGSFSTSGKLVMGRGIARQARDRFPGLDRALAKTLRTPGRRYGLLVSPRWPEAKLGLFQVKLRYWGMPTWS